MTTAREVPPFVPEGDGAPREDDKSVWGQHADVTDEGGEEEHVEPKENMVVMTIRVAPKTRDALRRFYRHDEELKYNSVSHVIQTAIDEFLERHSTPSS